MTFASTLAAKLNDNEFAGAVRASAIEALGSAQVKLAQAQEQGRTRLAQGVLVSADVAGQVSQYLSDLAVKIAPPAPVKRRAAPKAAAKKAPVRAARRTKAAA
ncbi:MAG: hypothetical protein V4582_03820 [Pseudomonadota bacterium]